MPDATKQPSPQGPGDQPRKISAVFLAPALLQQFDDERGEIGAYKNTEAMQNMSLRMFFAVDEDARRGMLKAFEADTSERITEREMEESPFFQALRAVSAMPEELRGELASAMQRIAESAAPSDDDEAPRVLTIASNPVQKEGHWEQTFTHLTIRGEDREGHAAMVLELAGIAATMSPETLIEVRAVASGLRDQEQGRPRKKGNGASGSTAASAS